MAKERDKPADTRPVPSVAHDPRASASIRRWKGRAGIAGFLLTLYLAHGAGLPLQDTLLRALAGGVVAYLLAWVIALTVWRSVITAELAVRKEQLLAEREERIAEYERRREERRRQREATAS